ncbi:hypothetical protein [Aureibacter tunicatorum]|uniref:Uncharacterized protein n=1 Tax=Aureibacter tunicatorum TaxID=866807 RepID=A0AAE3XTI2_9BACT|nr:hypothetical protein [Aureibacter tunicatorum]MDR6241384.1 hypothetical protein [Aureibacter tunicatorum]BDD06771.1 hypothetical protein AUTU_42540 [Aureibacter tunicatorum]
MGAYQLEREAELKQRILASAIEDAEILNAKYVDNELHLSNDPENYFRIFAEIHSNSLVQKIGNDYLISIGKVIGRQNEMYDEKERQNDIHNISTKQYQHTLTLNIPEGYECKGLESIKIDNKLEDQGKTLAIFKSDYTYENNQLIITIDEIYYELHIPKELYQGYRKVINSAADFNKVTLVLQKRSL